MANVLTAGAEAQEQPAGSAARRPPPPPEREEEPGGAPTTQTEDPPSSALAKQSHTLTRRQTFLKSTQVGREPEDSKNG